MFKFCSVYFLILFAQLLTATEAISLPLDSSSISPAIVSVQTPGMDSGTGVIVSPDGLVVTSSSLLTDTSTSIKIKFTDGRIAVAEVIATDSCTESALLRLRTPATVAHPFLRLADSSLVKVGVRAITAGNPLDAISLDHQVAFSSGTITGMYDVRSADAASRYCGAAIETDAAINAGSEGGALLNDLGHMIGMTCLCVDRARMRGCAIPSNRIIAAYKKYLNGYTPGVSTNSMSNIANVSAPNMGQRSPAKQENSAGPSKRVTSILPGTRIQIVSKSTKEQTPFICHCIVSATGRCDGTVVQIDGRLNQTDAGAMVLNGDGVRIGTVTHMNVASQLGAHNSGVSFFTPVEQLPLESESDRALIDLIAKSSQAFVFIGEGSGVVISEDGLVLTNYHVAGSQSTWTVRLGCEQHTRLCDIVVKDAARDLCLLKIRDASQLPFIKLGNSAALKARDQVLALGDPFKLGDKKGSPAASLGIISALHRNKGRYVDAIQTDCAINPGNSGGPLINMAGELIGLNGQIISRYGKNNTGVAFAIPIDQIKFALPILKQTQGRESDQLTQVMPIR